MPGKQEPESRSNDASPAQHPAVVPNTDRETSGFVRWILSLGVGAVAALAPWVGAIEVPGFTALATILPQHSLGLASAFVGALFFVVFLVRVVVLRDASPRALRRWFVMVAVTAVVSICVFVICRAMVTTDVEYGDDRHAIFATGFSSEVPSHCAVCSGLGPQECIRSLSFDAAEIESCWGAPRVKVATTLLVLLYAIAMNAALLLGAIAYRLRSRA